MTTRNLTAARVDDDLMLAAQMMIWRGVRHLPVLSGDKVVGMLSDRDIVARRSEAGRFEADKDRVSSIMSEPPIVAGPDDSLVRAAAYMLDAKIDCLPVVEAGRLVGLLTTTDILRFEVLRALGRPALGGSTAADVMTRTPLCAAPRDGLADAIATMLDHNIRHLPVVDRAGRVIGIVSDRDIRTVVGDPARAIRREREEGDGRQLEVADVMNPDPVVAGADEPLSALIQHFLDERVGAIVIVDEERKLVGMVSYLDLLRSSVRE